MIKLFVSILTSCSLAASPIVLTPDGVKDLILRQGPRSAEVDLEFQTLRLTPVTLLSNYDWRIQVETGYEYDKSVALLANRQFPQNLNERTTLTASLIKQFTTGTLLGFDVTRLSVETSPLTPTTFPPIPRQTRDIAGLFFEQSLYGNAFGRADRALVSSADLTFKAQYLDRANNLESVALEGIRQYWLTATAEVAYKESQKSLQAYRKLTNEIRRKTRLGQTAPGDLPQVLAEFELRSQAVKTAEAEFIKAKEDLITLLNLPNGSEIQLKTVQNIAPLPSFVEKKIEETRSVQSQKLKVEAAQEALDASESSQSVNVKFIGRAYSSGVNEEQHLAFEQMTTGTRPQYYAGLRLEYNFGSNVQEETILNRKMARDLASTRLRRQIAETNDQLDQASRNLKVSYEVAQSAESQKKYLEQAYRELQRSYDQGRIDISVLIGAINRYFDGEIAFNRALGNYSVAQAEWLASRDELVSDL